MNNKENWIPKSNLTELKNSLQGKEKCDLCGEKPENGVLVEKPGSMIVNGQLLLSITAKPLYICLDCLTFEIENVFG